MGIIIFIGFLIFCYLTIDNKKVDKKSTKKENKPKKNVSPYSEELMDKYYLKEWQKDLVRQGRFAPWSFKKKSTYSGELSDGQYYKDDDIGRGE